MKIDITKKYQTRNGKPVENLTYQPHDVYPFAGVVNGDRLFWTEQGYYWSANNLNDLDLVPVRAQLDLTKKYRTKDGREVRDLTHRQRDDTYYNIVGYIAGSQTPRYWTVDGYYWGKDSPSQMDLIEIPAQPEAPLFDPTKPVQTRDGKPARIISTDAKADNYPIVALIADSQGREEAHHFQADGRACRHDQSPLDLLNIPPKKQTLTRWINIYPGGDTGKLYHTKAAADLKQSGHRNRVACKQLTIEYTEGEGL